MVRRNAVTWRAGSPNSNYDNGPVLELGLRKLLRKVDERSPGAVESSTTIRQGPNHSINKMLNGRFRFRAAILKLLLDRVRSNAIKPPCQLHWASWQNLRTWRNCHTPREPPTYFRVFPFFADCHRVDLRDTAEPGSSSTWAPWLWGGAAFSRGVSCSNTIGHVRGRSGLRCLLSVDGSSLFLRAMQRAISCFAAENPGVSIYSLFYSPVYFRLCRQRSGGGSPSAHSHQH